jgi:hypothetical protein
MARLGAKRTVAGYLSEVARHALLWALNDGPLPDQINQNWGTLLKGLSGKWQPCAFTRSLIDFHAGHAWGFAHAARRGALGKEDHLVFCAPSVVDLVHENTDRPHDPLWSERGLSVQGWKVRSRAGAAKIEIVPAALVVSTHALERLYERIGGIDYDAFPALVGRVVDTVLHKIDAVAAAGVFFRGDSHAGITAIPVEGGLAVVEANEVFIGSDMPQMGAEVRIKRGNVSQRKGSVRLKDWFADDKEGPGPSLTAMYAVRTFYGFEDLNSHRADALQLLEMVVDRVEPSPISLYAQMGVQGPPHLAGTDNPPADVESASFRTLVAETKDALDWLQLRRDDQLYIFADGGGIAAAKAITEYRDASDEAGPP